MKKIDWHTCTSNDRDTSQMTIIDIPQMKRHMQIANTDELWLHPSMHGLSKSLSHFFFLVIFVYKQLNNNFSALKKTFVERKFLRISYKISIFVIFFYLIKILHDWYWQRVIWYMAHKNIYIIGEKISKQIVSK